MGTEVQERTLRDAIGFNSWHFTNSLAEDLAMLELVGIEFQNASLSLLSESTTNHAARSRKVALKQLTESVRAQGVLSPLPVPFLHKWDFCYKCHACRNGPCEIAV